MSVVEANSYSAKGKYAAYSSDEDEFNSYSAGIRKGKISLIFYVCARNWFVSDLDLTPSDRFRPVISLFVSQMKTRLSLWKPCLTKKLLPKNVIMQISYLMNFMKMKDQFVKLIRLAGIEAVVFWDAQDYPIRSGDHESVFQKIKETLSACPKVSIHAYVTNKLSDGLRSKYEQAQIIIHHLSRGEKANWHILVDILMLTMRREYRSNLFVLSKQFTEYDEMVCKLEGLYWNGSGVFLSDSPRKWLLSRHSSGTARILTSLFTKRGREADTGADCYLPSNSSVGDVNSFQSITRDLPFPFMLPCQYRYAETCIFMCMENSSILDNGEDVLVLRKNLEKALRIKGYLGGTSGCWGHFLIKETVQPELTYAYSRWGLERVAFNQGVGFDRVLTDILTMVSIHCFGQKPMNLLILSNMEKFGKGTRLAEVCEFLKEKHRCNVVVARIDQLVQLADQSEEEVSNWVTQIPPSP